MSWSALALLAALLAGRAAPAQNAISVENGLPGNPPSEWGVSGAGDASIVGFATDISHAPGETVEFKIDTPATDYRIDVYRLGWYAGLGAREVATVEPSAALPQSQPACLSEPATGLVDCGNWAVSATWTIPGAATSGVYLAKLVREDPEDGRASHVLFVVRDDEGGSDLLVQTSDTTWQAYNQYGGNSLYVGSPAGRAYEVSYNRPFTVRGTTPEDWVFNALFPLIRWLERNGYDVSYTTGVDTDRRGAELLEHAVFVSVGHDEYWSASQRANVEAARDAGVHLVFLSGNEVFWKTRWEPAIDGSATPHRTLVSYKETHAGAKIDPEPAIWTGTWRDPRAFNPEGPQPENALTGQIFTVNCCSYPLTVPDEFAPLRFWRNTSVAALGSGETATLPGDTLGYEWDEDLEDDARPPGLVRLSRTTVNVPQHLQDHGSSYGPGTATHHLTLYRHASGALVFGAGTIQWTWGLDDTHDRGSNPPDARMQQATVNLLADMGVQPETLQPELVAATASSDASAPTSAITAPADGASVQGTVVVTGTAADAGGGVVGGVEVSIDGGASWLPASGRESWSYTFTSQAPGIAQALARAVDDSGNLETPGPGIALTVESPDCPCTIWDDATVPQGSLSENDAQPVELGVKFRADADGFVTALRFYRSPSSGGPHSGRLWTAGGALLASVDFPAPGAPGWQQVALDPPVAITADTTYIASYHTPGFYAVDDGDLTAAVVNGPLRALADGEDGPNGVYAYGAPGSFPDQTYQASNYWADLVYEETPGTYTVFAEDFVPANPAATDGQPIEVGVKLRAQVPGAITALRFYKGVANTGIHTGHLWAANGTLLAEAVFTGETAEGWQEVALDPPVAIAADTTVVASYHSASGWFAIEPGGLAAAIDHPPLRLLANGEDGGNGVYLYTASSAFPSQSGNGSHYGVDVRFAPDAPFDPDPPTVVSRSPADGASNVDVASAVSATFDAPLDPATVTAANFALRDAAQTLVAASLAYTPGSTTVTLTPAAPLAHSQAYTATLVGGGGGIADLAGNPLAADVVWSFATEDPPPPPADEGPGGPILVVAEAANPFGRYFAEILRTEGLNYFTVTDLSLVDAALLAAHEVVILGEVGLDPGQVAMLEAWVDDGGRLVAMRPHPLLAPLLGLTGPSGTLAEGYLQIDTAQPPGAGLVAETLQFHGTADLWTLDGASALATLYGDAVTATAHPAVTLRAVGSNGGSAAAFAFDLARSVVTTRQGNPAWAGQERDGVAPRRSDDLFFGAAAGDPQPDWIDLSKVAIPQADEQQRLLAKLVREMTGHPLPRFWYFPSGHRAVVVLTGDQHGCCGATRARFDANLAADPPACSVDDWECVRSSSYVYPSSEMSDAQAAAYTSQGFELGVHVNTGCADWTEPQLQSFFTDQLASFAALYPSVPPMDSHRTHCIAWSDWATSAKVELDHGVRLDTNYYYWPPGWVNDTPGLFTGSGMIMRFADLDGSLIDVYQAATQMTDESGQSYPFTIDTLLDRAIGPEQYFGAFTANMHTDGGSEALADAIVASAQARGVPVVSGRQMLEWLDGRNGSSFADLAWDGTELAFTVSRHSAARNLRGMLPRHGPSGELVALARDGGGVAFAIETVKGADYAVFEAESGEYTASYGLDTTPPEIAALAAAPDAQGNVLITWTTDEPASSWVSFGTDPGNLDSQESDPALVTSHAVDLSGLLPGTTYYYRVTSEDGAANASSEPPLPDPPAEFPTLAVACAGDDTQLEFAAGAPGVGAVVVSQLADGEVLLAAAEATDFDGAALPAGWSGATWEPGGSVAVGAGALSVDGAWAATDALSGPGRSVEFSATFQAVGFQHAGFGVDLDGAPWAIFSTGTDGSSLQARTFDGAATNTSLGAAYLGAPHRYRIVWGASSVDFYADGALVASHPVAIAGDMRPIASDLFAGGPALSVDWLRASPYPGAASFASRVFDAGAPAGWGAVAWSSEEPAGTSVSLSVRAGATPVPDATWTVFAPLAVSGDPAGVAGRYAQYRADLTTGDTATTPALEDVTLACAPSLLCGNGALESGEACDDGNGAAGDGCSPDCAFEGADADGDGLANDQELLLGTDPLDADSDDDGFSDGAEIAASTDPLDPQSFPPAVPGLRAEWLALLALLLATAGSVFLRLRRRIA